MKHHTRTHAEIAALASTGAQLFKSPKPLRRDKLGRQIFSDGSWLDYNALGQSICGSYSIVEWLQQELQAWRLGRQHRLDRKRMHCAFRKETRKYPARICKWYIDGFLSVAEWPKRKSD